MEFKSLQIKNFRSFEDISLNLSNKNIFFGLNDVGKTNLLTALRFVFDRDTRRNDFIDSDYFEKKTDTPIEILVTVDISDNNEDSSKLRARLRGAVLSGQDLIYIRLIAKYDNSEMVGVAELFFGGDKENLQEITFLVRDREIEKIFIYLYNVMQPYGFIIISSTLLKFKFKTLNFELANIKILTDYYIKKSASK